jgi:RNA polymerase sigma-70 factor (ECF subfamily)
MAVREKRGSRPSGATTVDEMLPHVARGDVAAFAACCDRISGAVYAVVRRIVWDKSLADQVAAQVLVEVWRSASQFDPADGSGLSWVLMMARRRALSQAGAVSGRAAGLASIGVVTEQAAAGLLAHRGLASLPGPQREAVLLACCGCTWPEMADLARVPAVTVAERLRDGLLGLTSV